LRGQSPSSLGAKRYANGSTIGGSAYIRKAAEILPVAALLFGDEKINEARQHTADVRDEWPSLEEEREQVANSKGWFDPRFPRHRQSATVVAPAAPGPVVSVSPRKPAASSPSDSTTPRPHIPDGANPNGAKNPSDTRGQRKSESRVHDAHDKIKAGADESNEDREMVKVARQSAKRAKLEELSSLDDERDAVADSGGWYSPRH
jgi:hypothetical protein